MPATSPLLFPPTKSTDSVDFAAPFRSYIASAYGDDPDKFAAEIALLNRIRDDTRGAGKDLSGRDIMYRYYGQLELLDLRFPIDGKSITLTFTWSHNYFPPWFDAFSGKSVAQSSVAYEKACVIFNIAAICGAIAGSQTRSDPTGLKVSFNHLQTAAGLFQYINNNFLHPPSVDISRESVKSLADLMLAQAQELFVEKCLVENKSGQLVSKLAAQCGVYYGTASEGLSDDALKSQMPRAWIDIVKIKQKYFDSLAHYHKSIHLETDGKYGQVVTHMNKSAELAKEAESLSKTFARYYPNFVVASAPIQSTLGLIVGGPTSTAISSSLTEMCKALLSLANDRKARAQKDNDIIYHETVPPFDSVPALDKLSAVKPTTFAELLANGAADVPKIVGPDIFARLVPLSVHTASSVYSEEKAKLLREEIGAVEGADGEFSAALESMGIVVVLDKLKRVLRSGMDTVGSDGTLGFTEEIRGYCETVRREEIGRGTGTDDLFTALEGLKAKIKGILDEVGFMVDKEQRDSEAMRGKYGSAWTLEPSFNLTSQIRNDLRSYRESFDKGLLTDQVVVSRLDECRREISSMSRPVDEAESIFAETVRSAASVKKPGVAVGNLLDDLDGTLEDNGNLTEQVAVEKLDGMIQQLRKLKSERTTTLAELKTKVHGDDISASLLLNKNKESQVFQAELAKFKPLQARLASNISSQAQLLTDISADYEKLKNMSTSIRVLELRERRRNDLIKDWRRSFELWKEAKDGLKKGFRFYAELSDLSSSLRDTAAAFVGRRNEESNSLVKRIQAEEAMKGQMALQNEMARLAVSGTSSGPSGPLYAPPVSAQNLQRTPMPSMPSQPSQPSPTQLQVQPPIQPQVHAQTSANYGTPPIGSRPQSLPPTSAYGGAPTHPSTQQASYSQYQAPLYGGAPGLPQSVTKPVYGGAPGQNQQPAYGGAPASQPSYVQPSNSAQAVFGGAPSGQPSYGYQTQPGYSMAPQGAPSFSNPATARPVYGGAPVTSQPQPVFGGAPTASGYSNPSSNTYNPVNSVYGGAPSQPGSFNGQQRPSPAQSGYGAPPTAYYSAHPQAQQQLPPGSQQYQFSQQNPGYASTQPPQQPYHSQTPQPVYPPQQQQQGQGPAGPYGGYGSNYMA
ncbi:bck1-like resistance to osmotic shock [Entophlyctis luteolus]|nr:bck1-like resistance to osmotic shock [Entophlyctis luteolus]